MPTVYPSPNPQSNASPHFSLIILPADLQVNLLTYLRAYDLCSIQQTCKFYSNPLLVDAIVRHTAEHVYPVDLSTGFDQQPTFSNSRYKSSVTGELCAIATSTTTISEPPFVPATPPPSNKKGPHNKGSGKKGAAAVAKGVRPKPQARPKSPQSEEQQLAAAEEEGTKIILYNFEHLRNMELMVVARVLSRPEPASGRTGYFVSKSWCKTALRWLEEQQQVVLERQQELAAAAAVAASNNGKKKLSKKKARVRNRRTSGSDASPPWPNANADLLCEHACLQRCTNNKSAKARRRILDKQAWKILKKLYPDTQELECAVGECVQCVLEAETEKRNIQHKEEQLKMQRKQPLANPIIRQFYTRARGIPMQAVKEENEGGDGKGRCIGEDGDHFMSRQLHNQQFLCASMYNLTFIPEDLEDEENNNIRAHVYSSCSDRLVNVDDEDMNEDQLDRKPPAAGSFTTLLKQASASSVCPLMDGTYNVLPRAWCHAWRRFIKTGDPGDWKTINTTTFAPPDAAALLCDAHRLPLLPPHLEAFLCGRASQLLGSCATTSGGLNNNNGSGSSASAAAFAAPGPPPPVVSSPISTAGGGAIPGQAPDAASLEALRAAGLTPTQVGAQMAAMMNIERERQRQVQMLQDIRNDDRAENNNNNMVAHNTVVNESYNSKNEALDRENHVVVEIVTQAEFKALRECWPPSAASSIFGMWFCVQTCAQTGQTNLTFSSEPCRKCDATGRGYDMINKGWTRNFMRKASEKSRSAPASLEY